MAEFVRAQIFGTTFEITSRYVGHHQRATPHALFCRDTEELIRCTGTLIFSQLEWVLLVWFGMINSPATGIGAIADTDAQLCKRSTYRTECRCQEDYEALQHSGLVEEDIQRIEVAEAP